MKKDKITVGQLAKSFDVHPSALRYYEQIGLLTPIERTEAGYRTYGREDSDRLAFIQKAKRLGLELGEIKEILGLRERGEAPCCYVRDLVGRKIAEVDHRISELEEMRHELMALQKRAATMGATAEPQGICHIIEKA